MQHSNKVQASSVHGSNQWYHLGLRPTTKMPLLPLFKNPALTQAWSVDGEVRIVRSRGRGGQKHRRRLYTQCTSPTHPWLVSNKSCHLYQRRCSHDSCQAAQCLQALVEISHWVCWVYHPGGTRMRKTKDMALCCTAQPQSHMSYCDTP
jgi:hypothetical protein